MKAEMPLWVAIALPLLGYVAAAATELLRGKQALVREREARLEMRRTERAWARDKFEVDNLLELQDAIGRLARTMGASHHADQMEFKESGTWARKPLPDNLGGEESSRMVREFIKVRVRTLDDRVRALSAEWWEAASSPDRRARAGETEEDAKRRSEAVFELSARLYSELMEAIGFRLRTLVGAWGDE